MRHIPFPEQTAIIPPPPGRTEIAHLPVHVVDLEVTSCWALNWRERFSALFFGRVWVRVMDPGGAPPPMALDARRTIFSKP